MPFSPTVRDRALVSAARHCCVCHRYKGAKVEVHHIVPESKGGASDDANAITLCFDCHADAGHYNPQHPRGTKFSPAELRRHRDEWHAMVRGNNIQPLDTPDTLYCRFLLCKNFGAIREVTIGDLSNIPVPQPLLVTNEIRVFQRLIVDAHPLKYRHDKEWGDSYPDRDAYIAQHPDVPLLELGTMENYPYFEASRVPSARELQEKLAPRDGPTRMLLEGGVTPNNIATVFGYWERCGEDRFQEIYRLRPIWAIYLAATNLAQHSVSLTEIKGAKHSTTEIAYRPFATTCDEPDSLYALPSVPVPPNGTMLFPVATILGPTNDIGPEIFSQDSAQLSTGQIQVVSHASISASPTRDSALIGPAYWPRTISFQSGASTRQEQLIHEFNLSNLYTIDRYWEAGSCPHLFSIRNGKWLYCGELFARRPGNLEVEQIIVRKGTTALLICELELETTMIEEIRLNGQIIKDYLTLSTGEVVQIPVRHGDVVTLRGYYIARGSNPTDPWLRNSLIRNFVKSAIA
jgi:5-methylcytosine-specific restriction endonuclease McrA